jgi:hypothetical protein
MRKVVIMLSLLCAASFVRATETMSTTVPESWTCYATGSINMGTPGGSIPMTVYGKGDTELNAMSDAQSKCFSQGLSMCMIGSCYKK